MFPLCRCALTWRVTHGHNSNLITFTKCKCMWWCKKLILIDSYIDEVNDLWALHEHQCMTYYLFTIINIFSIRSCPPSADNLLPHRFYDVQCSTRRISNVDVIKLIIFQTENLFYFTGFKSLALLLFAALSLIPTPNTHNVLWLIDPLFFVFSFHATRIKGICVFWTLQIKCFYLSMHANLFIHMNTGWNIYHTTVCTNVNIIQYTEMAKTWKWFSHIRFKCHLWTLYMLFGTRCVLFG